jgi:hypothetical protein
MLHMGYAVVLYSVTRFRLKRILRDRDEELRRRLSLFSSNHIVAAPSLHLHSIS